MVDFNARLPPSSNDASPSGGPESELSPSLTARQQRIVAALHARDQSLSDMYLGALIAMAAHRNPDRGAQAAHSLRELMDKMHRHIDVAVPPEDGKMGDKVRSLLDTWGAGPGSMGAGDRIDKRVAKFLSKFAEFAAWHKLHRPSQVARVAAIIGGLDPTGTPLPPPVRDSHVAEWRTRRDFFVKVAHHDGVWSESTLLDEMAAFEDMLVSYLSPQTFADFDEIDALIAEGENLAK